MPKITTVPKLRIITLPKINSSHLKNRPSQKETIVFKPSIFSCENVSFREGNVPKEWMSWICFCWCFVYLFYRGIHHQWKKSSSLGEYELHFFHPHHGVAANLRMFFDPWKVKMIKFSTTRWWFYIFLIFTPKIREMIPFWLIFFKGVETTNQTSPRFIYIRWWK